MAVAGFNAGIYVDTSVGGRRFLKANMDGRDLPQVSGISYTKAGIQEAVRLIKIAARKRDGERPTPRTETAATAGEQDGLQEEGRGRRQEVTPQSAGETPADAFARFDGIMVEQQVRIAETGEIATLKMDAGRALREIQQREQAFMRLRECMMRGAT